MATETPEVTTIDPLRAAAELAERFREEAAERDRERRFPHQEMAELKRSGLLMLWVPREHGGLDAEPETLARTHASLAEGDSNIAQMFLIHTYGMALLNGCLAPDEVKARYYAKIARGEMMTNGFSEASGKTVFNYSVKLTPDTDDASLWRLNGRKFYCTGSLSGDFIYVLGATEDEEPRFHMGVCDIDTPGLTVIDDWSGMGQRTTSSGTVVFENVPVPVDSVWTIDHFNTETSLFGSLGQVLFSSIFLGMARGALRDAKWFVREHARPWPHAEVERQADDPYVISLFGQMETLVASADAMLSRACDARAAAIAELTPETRNAASIAAAQAKLVTGEAALRVSELLFQVCGTSAVLERWNLDRHWRNARTLTLHDPMTYKQRLVGDFGLNGTPPPISAYT